MGTVDTGLTARARQDTAAMVAVTMATAATVAIHKVKPILLWDKLQHVPSGAIREETATPPLENSLNSGVTREVAMAGIPGATAYRE